MSVTSTYDNPTIGIEFELFFPNGCEGLARELNTRAYNYYGDTRDCESDLAVSWDGSVGSRGGEVKFARPIQNSASGKLIERMLELANHSEARFGYSSTSRVEDKITKLESEGKILRGNDTGLHIHYGMPVVWNPINIMRLVRLARKNENQIKKLALRHSRQWASGSQGIVNKFTNMIETSINRYQQGHTLHTFNVRQGNRYNGLNLTNIGRENKNTVEFRFAHSAIMLSKFDFDEYKGLTDSMFREAFEDNTTCHWGNKYTLRYDVKDTIRSRHIINIFDKRTGDFLGKMGFQI